MLSLLDDAQRHLPVLPFISHQAQHGLWSVLWQFFRRLLLRGSSLGLYYKPNRSLLLGCGQSSFGRFSCYSLPSTSNPPLPLQTLFIFSFWKSLFREIPFQELCLKIPGNEAANPPSLCKSIMLEVVWYRPLVWHWKRFKAHPRSSKKFSKNKNSKRPLH